MLLRGKDDRLSLTTSKEDNQELPKSNSTSYTSLLVLKTGIVLSKKIYGSIKIKLNLWNPL